MSVKFEALVKDVKRRALVSGDTTYEVVLRTEDPRVAELITAPSDKNVKVEITE